MKTKQKGAVRMVENRMVDPVAFVERCGGVFA